MDDEGVPLELPKAPTGLMPLLRKRLPILQWAPQYDRTAAISDMVAGVTLGLTLVPQSIAYASLANLPVQYGLYSAYIGTILYVFFGTVKEVSIGPTSLMALFSLQLCRGLPVEFNILLSFLSGVMVFTMGLLRLGFLVELISPAVTSGFTSGTAIIITISQIKGLLGLSFVAEDAVTNIQMIAQKRHEIRVPDVLLGVTCCAVLLALRKLKDLPVSPKRAKLRKALWLVSIGRNALVVVAASTFAFLTHDPDAPLLKLPGHVAAGVPKIALPPFSVVHNNQTLGFGGMVRELGPGVLMLPVVMVVANIAIAKAFCVGGVVDATQEMLTLGLCNVAGSVLHAMPTCGAFTRSAVSHSSGVRTPTAGIYSGVITLLALMFLTKFFCYIPKACLSAVLICAVIFMVDIGSIRRLWASSRCELSVLLLTLAVCVLASVEAAVAGGVLGSLALLLRPVMRPQLACTAHKWSGGAVAGVRAGGALCYLNAERVARRARAAARSLPARYVLLDCQMVPTVDCFAAQVLERLVKELKQSQQKLVIFRAHSCVLERLESIEGLETRALRAASAAAALAAVGEEEGKGEETTALLHDVVASS